MPAWSIPRAGPLSDPQIDDLVSHILSLEPLPDAQAYDRLLPPWGPAALVGLALAGLVFLGLSRLGIFH